MSEGKSFWLALLFVTSSFLVLIVINVVALGYDADKASAAATRTFVFIVSVYMVQKRFKRL
jgi:hypothetical protein